MCVLKSVELFIFYYCHCFHSIWQILQKDAQWEAVAIAYSEREYAKDRANDLVAEAK